MLKPPTTCLTCETENQMMNVKSLTPWGPGNTSSKLICAMAENTDTPPSVPDFAAQIAALTA